jgi:diaminopimelate decarboxylase
MLAAEDPGFTVFDMPDAALVTAASDFGTPVYVIDLATVASAGAMMEAAFPRPWVWQYSLKANDLPAITAYLAQRGWGANVVSLGEWRHAQAAEVPNARVTLEGIGKTDAELEHAVQQSAAGAPLRWLAIESPEEADRLGELAREYGLGADGRPALDVLLRVNPDVAPETRPQFAVGSGASKFGMDTREIHALVHDGLSGGLRLRGVHVHTGSDLRDVAAWAEAGCTAVSLTSQLASVVETVDTVDVGGGFPVPIDGAPRPAQFVAALAAGLERRHLTLPPRHAIEPGRFLVGHAGWLVSRVLHSRPRRHLPQQTVLDAGMTELVRPALYGSRHDILPLDPPERSTGRTLAHAEVLATTELLSTSVEGPICELTDSFGTYQLPRLRRGDLVAIEGAGAYSSSFTSRYNGRPQPHEVLRWPDGSLQLAQRPLSAPRAFAPSSTRLDQAVRRSPGAGEPLYVDPSS